MVKMEKYCIKCRKAFDDMNFNNCPICTNELIEREKRKPIPSELRHKIFVRDGYRCRECGKNNKETSLEIDHIHPLSKGGRTTEENLQVLCTECNRAKKDDEWKDEEIEITRNDLRNLENQLNEAEENLKVVTNEDEIFALRAKIKKFKKVKIPQTEQKLNKLIEEEARINSEIKAQQEENKRRKNLFNKLYVELEGELLLAVCNHFSLDESSDEDNIMLLIDKYDEHEIYSAISSIKKELEEEAIRKELYDKLDNALSPDEINLFMAEFSFQGSKHELLNYLIFNYSEDEICSLKIKLVDKEQKRLAKIEKDKLKNNLLNSLSQKELSLFSKKFNLPLNDLKIVEYLIENYSEENIESLRVKLNKKEQKRIEEEKRKKEFKIKILESLTQNELYLFSKEFNLPLNDLKIVEYLIENYSEEEIESLRVKLNKKDLINELKLSLDVKQLIFLCKYLSLKQCTKDSLINYLEGLSLINIKKVIELMKENEGASAREVIYGSSMQNNAISNNIPNNSSDKKQNKLFIIKNLLKNNLHNSLTIAELIRFREKFGLRNSSNIEVVDYLVDNYSEEEIESMRIEFKNDLVKNLNKHQVIFLCKYFALIPNTKENLMKHIEDYSLENIEKAIEVMKKYDDGRPTKKIRKSMKDEKKRSWVDNYIFD